MYPSDRYICDLSDPQVRPSEKQLQHLNAMEWQCRKIRQKLQASDPWQSMVMEFTDLQTIASELGARTNGGDKAVRRSILKLYARYIAEWGKYSARERLQVRARAA